MLNQRDQAEGLRRILMPAKACPIKTLSIRLAKGKGYFLQDLVKDIHGCNIHFIDISLDQAQELPLALLNEYQVVIKLAQSSDSIKQAFGIIKLLAKSPENRIFGIIVSAQNAETAKTVFRNIKHASRAFLQIRLEFIGFSTLNTNWVSPVIMDHSLAPTMMITRDPIFTPQFGIAATQ
jgi:MinD-like ATPase involved in chromosome partitioning or flagellar assembly